MTADLTGARWRKSTYSNNGGQCIEVADGVPGAMPVRDSKDPEGPALTFTPEGFTAFVQGVKNDTFSPSA